MKQTSSTPQVIYGWMLAFVLQPLSAWLVWNYVFARHLNFSEPMAGWTPMIFTLIYLSFIPIPGFPSFGVAQALTILPAAAVAFAIGRRGIVRGLVQAGTALAVANFAWVLIQYLEGHWKIS